jgi:hypothetical protein
MARERPDYFVIVTEHDCDQDRFPENKHASNGSIVMETYLKDAALFQAVKRKENAGNRYGKVAIAKLVFLSDEEIKNLMEQ